ncbi:MAG: OmpH family outer membrane protein [Pseudomonadota bacterium]
MKTITKFIASASLAAAAFTTAPLAAQVQGSVATSSVSGTLLRVPSLTTAFQQVSTTYAAQLQTVQTKQTELNNLLTPYDTNSNGTIDQDETAALQSGANFQQIQTLRNEIGVIENQITGAQVYAVEQVLAQYQAALTEVAAAQQIVMVVDPASLQFAAEGADISGAVATNLAAKVTAVGIVPPAGWQPSPNSVQIFQDIQRRLVIQEARARAAQQQQEQQNTQAPAGR